MNLKPIKRLVIVGGGTAGWMTACYINQVINSQTAQPIEIILVESPAVEAIGVGEATVHSLRIFLASIGVPEGEFLGSVEGTLKHGILFKDWVKKDTPHSYFHAFEFPRVNDGVSAVEHWVNLRVRGLTEQPFDASVGPQTSMAMALQAPKRTSEKDYDGVVPYGYHLDAVLFGKYLRGVAKNRGVTHIRDHVDHVTLTQDGNIDTVQTRENGTIRGDFFIDCTGFAAILMGALGNDDYIDYSSSLLCDRAVAARVDLATEEKSRIRPYTTSTAKGAGWIWDIDLYSRRGTGYVYSSTFLDDDAAEHELRSYLSQNEHNRANVDMRFLKMRVGRRTSVWHKNCVSVGLSAGFLEPLESTGIYFIDMAVRFLCEYFPTMKTDDQVVNRYNGLLGRLFDETRDFIVLHYVMSQRRDTAFWRTYANEVSLPDTLKARLDLWRTKIPSPADFADYISLFVSSNYSYILYGMDWQHSGGLASIAHIDPQRSTRLLDRVKAIQQQADTNMPTHISILEKLRTARR